jgi:hypothetical protein
MNLLRQAILPGPLAIFLLAVTTAVLSPPTALAANGSDRLSEAESHRAARDLRRWLETDCEESSLMTLTRYKQAIVSDLIGALEKGSPANQREVVRREADASYDELVKQQDRNPERRVGSTRDVYVKRDVDNFEAQYRARAAQALAAIGGPNARAALEGILAKASKGEVQLREDVRRAIELFLSKAK